MYPIRSPSGIHSFHISAHCENKFVFFRQHITRDELGIRQEIDTKKGNRSHMHSTRAHINRMDDECMPTEKKVNKQTAMRATMCVRLAQWYLFFVSFHFFSSFEANCDSSSSSNNDEIDQSTRRSNATGNEFLSGESVRRSQQPRYHWSSSLSESTWVVSPVDVRDERSNGIRPAKRRASQLFFARDAEMQQCKWMKQAQNKHQNATSK